MTRRVRRRRRRHFNGCGDKARFGTYDEAKAEQHTQTPYPCEACGCWHLTMSGAGTVNAGAV